MCNSKTLRLMLGCFLILLTMAVKGQNLSKDLALINNFIQKHESFVLSFQVNSETNIKNQAVKQSGSIVRYQNTYCTQFNNRIHLRKDSLNLVLDESVKKAFLNKVSVENAMFAGAPDFLNLQNIDSTLVASGYSLTSSQLSNGDRSYTFTSNDCSEVTELLFGKDFLKSFTFSKSHPSGDKSVVRVSYSIKSSVSAQEKALLDLNKYLIFKRGQPVSLSKSYSTFELLNNYVL